MDDVMGFKFRKRIKIAPGVNINLSKSGVSTSIGKPGATVNVGKNGVKATVGIPGTGVSYSQQLAKSENITSVDERVNKQPHYARSIVFVVLIIILALVFFN